MTWRLNLIFLQKAKAPVFVENVLSGLPRIRSGLSKTKDGKQEWKQTLEELLESDMYKEIDKDVWLKMKKIIENVSLPINDKGSDYIKYPADINYKKNWYLDSKIHGVCNHESRSHIKEDLYRYLFVSCFAELRGRSPKLYDFPTFSITQPPKRLQRN